MGLTADDQLAIQQLVARYNHAIDGGDGPGYAAMFVEDGVLDAGDLVVEGRDALTRFGSTFASTQRAPHHVASSLVIDGPVASERASDGQDAEESARLRAHVQLYAAVGEPPRHQVTASGVYADTLVKVDGRCPTPG